LLIGGVYRFFEVLKTVVGKRGDGGIKNQQHRATTAGRDLLQVLEWDRMGRRVTGPRYGRREMNEGGGPVEKCPFPGPAL